MMCTPCLALALRRTELANPLGPDCPACCELAKEVFRQAGGGVPNSFIGKVFADDTPKEPPNPWGWTVRMGGRPDHLEIHAGHTYSRHALNAFGRHAEYSCPIGEALEQGQVALEVYLAEDDPQKGMRILFLEKHREVVVPREEIWSVRRAEFKVDRESLWRLRSRGRKWGLGDKQSACRLQFVMKRANSARRSEGDSPCRSR